MQAQASQTTAQKLEAEFATTAARLVQQRLDGAEESEKLQEEGLSILDGIVLEAVNAPGPTAQSLEALNQRLAGLVTQQPAAGEDYRVVELRANPPVFGLAANLALGGPAAVRVYGQAGGESRYRRVARIDRFAQKDFLDSTIELILVARAAGDAGVLFLTVAGRTDQLQTGAFTAWRLEGERLRAVWSSELLQQSSYESAGDGLRLTYCAQPDEVTPRICRRMTRERYAWDGAQWRRVEQRDLPVPKQ